MTQMAKEDKGKYGIVEFTYKSLFPQHYNLIFFIST